MISPHLLYELFQKCERVCIDSRLALPGDLFIAVSGPNFNGNSFAKEALKKGALYAIVEDLQYNQEQDDRIFLGEAKGEATLQKLASLHREQLSLPIIGITGSNGKTTTKELLGRVLSRKYKTVITEGNLNNHIGVPLTLLKIKAETQLAIIEMGANHPGEIAFLSSIAKPGYAYITSFGKAHLEGFGGLEGVIKAKSELYDYVRGAGGVIFYNADDPIQLQKCRDYKNSFSFSEKNNLADCHYSVDSAEEFLKIYFKNTDIKTSIIGRYNAPNIGMALAAGTYFGVDEAAVKTALEAYFPDNNRSQVMIFGNNKIIADAYNANPSSMRAALENLAAMPGEKMAILGDMFELGTHAQQEHQEIADYASYLNIKALLVGKCFSSVKTNGCQLETFEALALFLKSNFPRSQTILIKGSRGMQLERAIELFRNHSVDG